MIKRTAQEWADFTGEVFCVDEEDIYTFNTINEISVKSEYVSDFEEIKLNQIIKPSEPCVLIPTRLLEEASELIQRMNSALDGKMKEMEEKTDWMQKIKDSGLFDLAGSYIVTNETNGDELFCLSPLRGDRSVGSFSINLNTGYWKDFATLQNGTFGYLVYLKNLPV